MPVWDQSSSNPYRRKSRRSTRPTIRSATCLALVLGLALTANVHAGIIDYRFTGTVGVGSSLDWALAPSISPARPSPQLRAEILQAQPPPAAPQVPQVPLPPVLENTFLNTKLWFMPCVL